MILNLCLKVREKKLGICRSSGVWGVFDHWFVSSGIIFYQIPFSFPLQGSSGWQCGCRKEHVAGCLDTW